MPTPPGTPRPLPPPQPPRPSGPGPCELDGKDLATLADKFPGGRDEAVRLLHHREAVDKHDVILAKAYISYINALTGQPLPTRRHNPRKLAAFLYLVVTCPVGTVAIVATVADWFGVLS